jgi:hypothetical protein
MPYDLDMGLAKVADRAYGNLLPRSAIEQLQAERNAQAQQQSLEANQQIQQMRQAVLSKVDVNNPDSLKSGAAQLYQIGDNAGGKELIGLSMQIAKESRLQGKVNAMNKVLAGEGGGLGNPETIARAAALGDDKSLMGYATFLQGQDNRATDEANKLAAEERAQTRQIAEENRRNKAETDKDLKKISVPDYDIQPDIIPSAKDAEAVKKANAAAQKLIRLGETLKGLTDKNGFKYTMDVPFSDKKLGDPIAKQMDSIVQQMKLEQKTIDDLGALVGADFKFLNQFPDPTSMIDAQSMGDVGTWKTQIDDFLGRSKMAVDDIASARGYIPKKSTNDFGDAKQAPDGNFYVERNGKFFRVEQ